MGECGCANFNVQHKLRGPNDTFYLICIYDSCKYCETGAAVILYKMTAEECREWGVDDMPITEITYEGTWISILDPDVLGKLVGEAYTDDKYDADLIRETIQEKFREAIWATRKDEDRP
jgi:hypothetical protein